MKPEHLPPDLQNFLRAHIESHEQLALLLLLHRHPDRSYTVASAADESSLARELVLEALGDLSRKGFVRIQRDSKQDRYRYALDQSGTESLVGRLAAAYEQNRIEVIQLVGSHAFERVREAATRVYLAGVIATSKLEDESKGNK